MLEKHVSAFVDAANPNWGVRTNGWKVDYARFRVWLRDKYGVATAYVFVGYMPGNVAHYQYLERVGFRIIFKEIVYTGEGVPKGNCDADLVLTAVKNHYEVGDIGAVLVSSDGDYASLVRFWNEKGVAGFIVSPSVPRKCSVLLRKTETPIVYLQDVKSKIEKRT